VIIFRYLARDILAMTGAVTIVLMLVIISSRFVKYLAQAATGQLDANILFAIIGYRIPGFLELILPMAFFLAILLVHGRMYIDSEMTVLHACGMAPRRMMLYTLTVAFFVAILVAWLSLTVSPSGLARAEALLNAQSTRGEFESLESGKFYSLRGGRGVVYSEYIDEDSVMRNVFLAEPGKKQNKDPARVVVFAAQGYPREDHDNGERFLVLENGYRVQGVPGRADFQVTSFERYGQRLAKPNPLDVRREKALALATSVLWSSNEPAYRAALQWRISVPFLVLVVTLIAVPLSRTNSRQGRYVKIFPAIVIYVLYLVGLNAARGEVEQQHPLAVFGLWWVHFIFVGIAATLIAWDAGWRPVLRRNLSGGSQTR
jgi:lipopolysaccharide export system permease protein